MSTFYVGSRPVLRGRSTVDFLFPEKANTLGGADHSFGVYSNYSLFAPGVLAGAPDNNHTPGDGAYPHGYALSRRFEGIDTKSPLDDPGSGARLSWGRYHPFEYKGLDASRAFASGFGREFSYTGDYHYSNLIDDGVGASIMDSPGHAERTDQSGAPATFGAFHPHENKGVTTQPLEGSTETYPEGVDGTYGRARINEWQGVASARVL